MAYTTVRSTYATKSVAGGSGDNYIPDGYIKSVEKVWIDSYLSTADLSTACAIQIADIPAGKKITSIDITIETLDSQSSGTISLGTATSTTRYMAVTTINHALSYSTISWPTSGLAATDAGGQLEVGKPAEWPGITDTGDVYIFLDQWTMTYASVTSIVRYT